MLGFYRALFERNIPVDFIHPDDIVAGAAGKYDVVFFGYPLMVPQPVADALKAYVRGGGTLISEARPAWNDERGFANPRIPGAGLDDVFGAREKRLQPAETVTFVGEHGLDGPLAALAGRAFTGLSFAEELQPTGRVPHRLSRDFPLRTARAESRPIVMSRYGSGRAILIGSFPSAAFEQDPDKARASGDLLALLTSLAGVTPDVRIDGAPGLVEARFLESADALVLIAINHSDSPQRVTLTFTPDTPEAIWLNMETGASVNFVAGSSGPSYTHSFARRDVLVLMIRKALR